MLSRLLISYVIVLTLSACAMKDNRPALPNDVPPPNHLVK